MIHLTFEEIARVTGGTLVGLEPAKNTCASPIIDSRKAAGGTFFVALPGERFDGNDFAASAIELGSEFAITTRTLNIPSIVVDDALSAITALAQYVREEITDTVFIGLTGSQGKTTTKDLLTSILSAHGETISPTGSFNNEIGVPLTILSCSEESRYCIIEMGARHQGDIQYLCSIAKPDIGLVLVVGTAHLGEFGSQEVIAKTKGELIDSLPESGIAILGNYDSFTPHMGEARSIKRVIFGENSSADIRATDVEVREGRGHFDLVTPSGRTSVGLRLVGAHQIANALAAAAVAYELGIETESIGAALSMAESASKWRMELHDEGGLLIVNDSYNANPESMRAALRTLAYLAQERGGVSWAFLGKMHELGESESAEHRAIGRLASELGIDQLVSVGTDLYLRGLDLQVGKELGDLTTHFFLTQEDALGLSEHFDDGDVILVKASRAEHLDELAEKMIALAHLRNESANNEGAVE